MHCGAMDPDCMQWSPCSEAQCIQIECIACYAAWPKASRLNAVDSMNWDWMQFIPFSVVKCIPIECRGFHEARLNAVDSMQREEMEPYWMQWILCSMIECSGFHAACLKAVDFMQHGPKHPDWVSGFHAVWCNWFSLNAPIPCIKAQWFLIECTRFHAAF